MRSIAVAFSVPALLLGWSTAARAQQIHELTVRPSAEPALAMPANVLRLVAEPPASPAPASPAPMTAPTVIPVADSAEPAGWRIWGRAEYIHWWYKDGSSPPLVTMTVGPDQVLPTLDRPTTAVLYGNTLDSKDHPGGRLTVGFALPCRDCGFELTGLLSGWRDNDFFVASGGIPILGRPFFDVSSGVPVPVVENVANPTIGANAALAGSVTISNPSRMYGLEGNCVCCWCEEPCGDYRVQLLYGVRYLAYNEDLKITEDLAAQDGSGQTFIVHDSFSARNDFFGGQVGIRGEYSLGNFFIRGTAKLALGVMHHQITIDGFTIDSTAGTGVGGLLALPTNIGRYASDSFSIMPEGEVQLGMYVTERLRVYGGYNFLYASQVARPGDQIDPFVNTNFLAFAPDPLGPIGPLRPDFALRRTDFWAQGFSLGVELDW